MDHALTSLTLIACAVLLVLAASDANAGEPDDQVPPAGVKNATWPYQVEIGPPRPGDKNPAPQVALLWLPENVRTVRGLFYPGTIVIGGKLSHDQAIRAACAELGMGVVYFKPGLGLSFIQGGGERLEQSLARLAKESGHPEVEFAPLLTAGHSTDGIFCRNVAYWKPHRVMGVLMLKSGNFHQHIEDLSRSLAGVPLTQISGEFEEYGPEGGDLGVGLRSEYSSHPDDKKKQNQTQWVMARMQMLERRRKNPDNIWSLVVHRGGGHTAWDGEVRDLAIAFIRSCANTRLPKEAPDGKTEVRCKPLTAKECWLLDADIKTPKHQPAPYDQYAGDKALTFCVPDQAFAEALFAYHGKGWPVPDPTASEPAEKRFWPPAMLRDLVDAPAPKDLAWKGGDGAWKADEPLWRDAGQNAPWNETCRAVIQGGGKVTLPASLACTGLHLGQGCTLDLQDQALRVRWHAALDEGSTLRVRVVGGEPKGRAGKLSIDGNATLGGTLVVEASGEFPKGGSFPVFSANGVTKGEFKSIVLPEGWQTKMDRRALVVVVPKPGQPAKK